jgi:hypothetical protein
VQLSLREELKKLEEEISSISCTHFPIGSCRYSQVAFGLLEMGVYEFGFGRGASLSPFLSNQRLVRSVILPADQYELVVDIAASLNTKLTNFLPKVAPEHRFGFKLLHSGNVLVALDPRDMEPLVPEDGGSMVGLEETGVTASPNQSTESFDEDTEV